MDADILNHAHNGCATLPTLQFAMFLIGIVATVGDYEMVEQVYSHQFGGISHTFGQHIVFIAGNNTPAGMVVAECHHRGIAQQCLFYHHPHIYRCFRESAS